MKRHRAVYTILIAMSFALCTTTALCEDKKQELHWYRLEIQTGDSTYQCFGNSTFDEKEFAKLPIGTEFVALHDVAYIDNAGKVKGWQEWDSKALPRLYVNPGASFSLIR